MLALAQARIERFQHIGGICAGFGAAAQVDMISARARFDPELLFDQGEMFIKLPEQGAGKAVVLEGQGPVGHARVADRLLRQMIRPGAGCHHHVAEKPKRHCPIPRRGCWNQPASP